MTEIANHENIKWTPEKVRKFKAEYNKAASEGKEVFLFNNYEFFTRYAVYLIEYLKHSFKSFDVATESNDIKPRYLKDKGQ